MESVDLSVSQEASSTLPNFPLFVRLLGYAHRLPSSHIAVLDNTTGTCGSYLQLLNDVLNLRKYLQSLLDVETKKMLNKREEVFIILLAPPGYEYVVGFLAILALGAAVVPISPHVPLQEALYFAEKSTSRALVFHPKYTELGISMQTKIKCKTFTSAAITSLFNNTYSPGRIFISSRDSLDPNRAGLVIFTSGTTGPPKAVILPREIMSSGVQALADHYEITPTDKMLHMMPVHHIAGITVCFLPFLLAGACVTFEPFDVKKVWENWRTGSFTVFGGVPTMFTRLMRYYEDEIRESPDCADYVRGLQSHRFIMSGTSALPRPLRMKWYALAGGKRILERYGASEFSTGILTPLRNSERVPDGSVGVVLPGCDIKLSHGDEGEILVKTPGMFSRYHQNPTATLASFDESGYYRTGDRGRREGSYFFILGRASIDIIKSGGYKISALDVEREIMGLDYISEVSVMGVADEEFGQRVAAVIVLKDDSQVLSIDRLRNDLRRSISAYKLPTLLYVTQNIAKTASGKIQKKALGLEIFESGKYVGNVQVFQPQTSEVRAKL